MIKSHEIFHSLQQPLVIENLRVFDVVTHSLDE